MADHPDFALGHLEDHVRQHVADAVRVVDIGIKRVPVLAGIVGPDRAARLHVLGLDAADDITAANDVSSSGEGGFGLRLVAAFIGVGDVVGILVPNSRRRWLGRIGRRGDRRERLVIDLDQLGGVLRLRQTLGDDNGDRVADITDPIDDQRRPLRRKHRRPVRLPAGHSRLGHGEPVGGVIGAGINGSYTRRRRGRARCERLDHRMRVRRPQEHRIELSRQISVVLIPTFARQQPGVFKARYRLADSELDHRENSQHSGYHFGGPEMR